MADPSTPNITSPSPAVPPTSTTHPSFPHAPPPWTTKCTTYLFAFRVPQTTPLPTHIVYSPLSASHPPFSSESLAGRYHGGLAMVQIVRYSETPVGPYDELVIMPGDFDVPVLSGSGGEGVKKKVKKNTRITGIWVSQKDTCWNGRKNWNIPKHLARFSFTPHNQRPSSSPSSPSSSSTNTFPSPPLTISVCPHSPPTAPPFFTCTILPVPYFPFSFPLSTSWGSFLGLDPHLVQPALPTGPEDEPELCGSADWKRSLPVLRTRAARVVWIDLRQPLVAAGGRREDTEGDEGDEGEGDALLGKRGNKNEEENWWPGGGRWRLGIWCQDGELTLGEAEVLV